MFYDTFHTMEDEAKATLAEQYDDANAVDDSHPEKAIAGYRAIFTEGKDISDEAIKIKEQSIISLAALLAKLGKPAELKQLFIDTRAFFNVIPKARTAKIVRDMIDAVGQTAVAVQLQIEIVQDGVEWCVKEKRTSLKHRLQCRLANLHLRADKFKDALAVISGLVREVRKLDDKLLLVEIFVIEARVHMALQNVAKAKGALTAGRSNANAIYCPPALQAQIDALAGTLCAMESDYKTGFSYFYEAFEGYNTINKPDEAIKALKYMLLCKIMTSHAEDVYSIINGKSGIKYAGIDVEAMRAVADTYKARDIHQFEKIFDKFKPQLADDAFVQQHLSALKNQLLEQNLQRLVEPFSRVQTAHIAKLINLPPAMVEAKLSEMILDGKLLGTLDQGSGDLIVFEPTEPSKTYTAALGTIKELGLVVDQLFSRAKSLSA